MREDLPAAAARCLLDAAAAARPDGDRCAGAGREPAVRAALQHAWFDTATDLLRREPDDGCAVAGWRRVPAHAVRIPPVAAASARTRQVAGRDGRHPAAGESVLGGLLLDGLPVGTPEVPAECRELHADAGLV